MRKILLLPPYFISLLLASLTVCTAQEPISDNLITKDFEDADAQYNMMMKNLPSGEFPKTFEQDTLRTSGSGWWCSGFYTGSLLYIFEQTKDSLLYHEAMRMLDLLKKEQYNTTTHDLGFMMYCSFGNALRIAPKEEYKKIIINSARSLATRFNPVTGCIKSWNSRPGDFLVIIDNMMNLELLFRATALTGDSAYYKIAVTHANTTMKNHFRADYSSYHVLNYDSATGKVKEKKTAQGAGDNSAWARGQAWGLYGFTVMYRETKDPQYLDQANKIASFILNNPRLPADKIPYWDFDAPGIPNALRDASAAAIIAAALLELSISNNGDTAQHFVEVSKQILQVLSSPEYKAEPGTNGGFIVKHCVGHKPAGTEIDVPLSYSDYYFLEALKRLKAINQRNARQ